MNQDQKRNRKASVVFFGYPVRPITVDKCAVFNSDGKIYHTSRVIAINEKGTDHISFETHRRKYRLNLSPFPLSAVNPLPTQFAQCA